MIFEGRTKEEKTIICKAYDFEIKAIKECDATMNPWFYTIMKMENGETVWEFINVAVEAALKKA